MEGSLIAGRYRVDEQIGEGGVAVVYRGLDISLEREIAIKVLKEEHTSDAEIVSRFQREAHAAAKLNHPNIVQIYDTGSDNGIHFIVMEYLPEPDFKRIIREYAPLPLRKVLQVSIECCRALAYAHRVGIVHRDVKPHNILFTNDGHAKLSDFGIAAITGECGLTDDGMVLGSAHYMSPEQAQGRAMGPQSDLYSLGIVMYEALTGSLPFNGNSAAEIAAKHVQERVPPLHLRNVNMGPSVEFVVGKALMRDLARRYRNANEMLMDLEKLADGVELDQTGILTPNVAEEATVRISVPITQTQPPGAVPPRRVAAPSAPEARPVRPSRNNAAMMGVMVGAIILGILALAGVVWLAKVTFYPGQDPKNVQIPMVKGLAEAEAARVLSEAGLQIGHITYVTENDAPAGVVIAQSPEVGATVRTDTRVNITVNKGKEEVTVVNVAGKDLRTAEQLLIAAGLQLGEVERVFSDQVPENEVISQEVAAGARVEEGHGIDLVVSKGPEKEVLPDDGASGETGLVNNGGDGNEQVAEPFIEIVPDETYQAARSDERRVIVRVTAQGVQARQEIKIVVSDDVSPRLQLDSRTLKPGDSFEMPVIIRGNAEIEVYRNGTVVHSDSFMLDASVQ